MLKRANGIDFSKWADDWILPETTKLDFAIQRFGYGTTRDEQYDNHSKRMWQVGIRGGYWYYNTGLKWYEQVDMFLKAAENHPFKIHMLWWDVEGGYNDLSNQRKIANETQAALQKLQANFDGMVGLYTNRNIYNNYLFPTLKYWLEDIPLWLAVPVEGKPLSYFNTGDPYTTDLKRKLGNWFMWQVSFKGDPNYYGIVGKKAVDVNVYHGSRWSMMRKLGIPFWERFKKIRRPGSADEC